MSVIQTSMRSLRAAGGANLGRCTNLVWGVIFQEHGLPGGRKASLDGSVIVRGAHLA